MIGKDLVVFGIPRGGVITADVIAQKLNASFDILIPRKIGAPHNQELAIGAVVEDGTTYLNDELIRMLEISSEYIDKVKSEQIGWLIYYNNSYSWLLIICMIPDMHQVYMDYGIDSFLICNDKCIPFIGFVQFSVLTFLSYCTPQWSSHPFCVLILILWLPDTR